MAAFGITSHADVASYLSGMPNNYISGAPEELHPMLENLWPLYYGAYIFQGTAEPNTCGTEAAACMSPTQVGDAVETVLRNLVAIEGYDPVLTDHMGAYFMSSGFARMESHMSKIAVASFLKYVYTVMYVRHDAYNAYLKLDEEARVAASVNVDWLSDGDIRHCLFLHHLTPRESCALKMMGTELYSPLLDSDRQLVKADDFLAARMEALFLSPRYRSYKTFVFDRSSDGPVNTTTWLKARARRLLAFTLRKLGPHEGSTLVDNGLDTYTDSMRTSTTGCVLRCADAVFIPKSVEGDRLLNNLFSHHLKQLLPSATHTLLDGCVTTIHDFVTDEQARKQRRNAAPAHAHR